ncbi:BadF/BadG/BcrA/BcrD ATPase family protein, partial [Mesorhizobium sp.]
KSRVETDAEIALEGAVGSGDGAMAILGTGTAYMARKAGKSHAIGGWGFQVGDQGSGARIGRDLLEQTLLAYDGIRPGSPLTDAMLAVFRNNPEDVVEFTTNAKPGDFGGFAPKVFEHAEKGDLVANWILDKAVADVEASLGALELADDAPLCLLGGLAPLYAPRLAARYQALLKAPLDDALGGAVQMAARIFAGKSGGAR